MMAMAARQTRICPIHTTRGRITNIATTSAPESPAVLMYMKNQVSPSRRSNSRPQTEQVSKRWFQEAKRGPCPQRGQRRRRPRERALRRLRLLREGICR